MLCFDWELGRDIVKVDDENKYSRGFYVTLSRYLTAAFQTTLKCTHFILF